MNKRFLAAATGSALGLLVTTQLAGPLLAQEADQDNAGSVYEQLDLFGSIFNRIRSEYVEEVDEADLIEAAVNGMLTSLDPHSSYLSPEDAEEMRVQTRGEFGGLGIQVTQEDGWVKVISPMDGTPAEAAGIEAGDFITAVDGESLLGLTLDEAVDLMRGPVGSEITLKVAREGVSEPFDVTITRDNITVPAVTARTEGRAVVLRVATFNDQTYSGIEEGLKEQLELAGGKENVDGVIIDLRRNPGGLLNQAIMVSDAFLDAGEIVSTRGRDPEEGDRWNAQPGDLAEGMPIVVLIDEGSASASEIVAGALQDHERAVVVGTKSFGKGSVQTVIPMENQGAMRLTTARYYTPSGRSIQALGIQPDIVIEQPDPVEVEEDAEENTNTRSEADLRGSLNNDSLTEDEAAQREEEAALTQATAELRQKDFQLAYAVDLLHGLRAVMGE